jgi:hypothetical protein
MEIKLDSILELNLWTLSHSAFEGGQNSGENYWCANWPASMKAAEDFELLDSEEKLQAMRDYAGSFGAWTREEIESWDSHQLNALFLQWVAGDCRELGADRLSEIDWEEAEELQESGRAPSNLFQGTEGSIYFYLGN